MAIDLSALATDAQYRAKTGDKANGTDPTLNLQLTGTTRALERRLHVATGGFTEHTETYIFPGMGGTRLWLRDGAGMAYFLQSVPADGIGVDTAGDGGFDDYGLDLDDTYVGGFPENAALQNEPYIAVDLYPSRSSGLRAWPDRPASVKFTGATWGLPSDSDWLALLADLVVHRTKELRDAGKIGPAGELSNFEGGVPMGRQSAWIFREVEALVGRALPVMSLGSF